MLGYDIASAVSLTGVDPMGLWFVTVAGGRVVTALVLVENGDLGDAFEMLHEQEVAPKSPQLPHPQPRSTAGTREGTCQVDSLGSRVSPGKADAGPAPTFTIHPSHLDLGDRSVSVLRNSGNCVGKFVWESM